MRLTDGPHRITLPVRNTVSLVLVEDVLTALAKLFCLSEFIVSLHLVETMRRPSLSYFARQNYNIPTLVEIDLSALAKLFCLFD